MLQVEVACREFGRETGNDGKIVWPIDITEEQLTEVMSIPTVFTPNTRQKDQLDGVAIWAIRDRLLLATILKSWQSAKPWVGLILACFETDKDLKQDWELRMAWTEDLDEEANITELTDEVDKPLNLTNVIAPPPPPEIEVAMIPGRPPDKKSHREWLKNHLLVRRMFNRIHAKRLRGEEDPEFSQFGEAFIDDLLSEEDLNPEKKREPFTLDFDDLEVDALVSNFGEEDQLW